MTASFCYNFNNEIRTLGLQTGQIICNKMALFSPTLLPLHGIGKICSLAQEVTCHSPAMLPVLLGHRGTYVKEHAIGLSN